MNDSQWMRKAIRLAKKAWGMTSPNPLVGAVVVKDGEEVGSGWHKKSGEPHAEINALAMADYRGSGATIYITLEPCCTYGKTPPCVEAIVKSGIKRAVIGTLDPNPKHYGKGVDLLKAQGIKVTVGVERERCQRLNEAFFCWIRHGRPYVMLKLAMTVDGKIATTNGQSQWISCPKSRLKVQKLRQWADAILVGAETVRCDNPSLIVRMPNKWSTQPLRIIASQRGELDKSSKVFKDGMAKTRIVSFQSGAEWNQFFLELGRANITALLVEGGGEIAGHLLHYNLIDKIVIFIAPMILGGKHSRTAFGGPDPLKLADAKQLKDINITRSGADSLLTGYLTDVHRMY